MTKDDERSTKSKIAQGDLQYAVRFMKAVRKRIRKEVDIMRPEYEYVMVDSINAGTNKVRVYYPNDQDNAFNVTADSLLPLSIGQTVRICGKPGDKQIVGLPNGVSAYTAPGFIQWSAGSTAPPGWLIADGSSFDPIQYAALFAQIGTTFGGTVDTPLLPNLMGVFPRGSSTGIGSTGGASTHTHTTPAHLHTLSGLGKALIAFGTGNIWRRDTNSVGFTTNAASNWTGGTAGSTGTGSTSGADLAGTTDSGGAGTSGSASSLPPYVNLLPLIKF